jgi:iron complex outermembrane receptor protein
VTAGARFNVAQIKLDDTLGTSLDSDNRFSHLNPVVGLTYKITPNVTAYAGYSQANRAPTPLELGCSDPAHPCLIDAFLVSDPPLKQVISSTYEAGLRGSEFGQKLKWNIGAYRTISKDDIINAASEISGFGFFQNAAKTRRQGVEAGLTYKEVRWNAYINYAFVDATFQTPLTLSSPQNPAADADGNIFVVPGDRIPAIPQHRFKAGFEYSITQPWTVGADLNAVGSQYLIGHQTKSGAGLLGRQYAHLHKINKNVEVFGLVQNLFNQRYYAAGTFFDTQGISFLTFNDPRTFIPGMPLAAYAGIRATF